MKTFRHSREAQFLFSLAEQQKISVAHLLGLRPNNESVSYNELEWWQARAMIRPLQPERNDIFEARFVGVMAGKKPQDVIMDWFSLDNDPDYIKSIDEQTVRELQEAEARRKAKEHGQTD